MNIDEYDEKNAEDYLIIENTDDLLTSYYEGPSDPQPLIFGSLGLLTVIAETEWE